MSKNMRLDEFAGWSRTLRNAQYVYSSDDQPEEFFQCGFYLSFSKMNVDEFSRVVTLEDGTNTMIIIGADSAEIAVENGTGCAKLTINCDQYPAFASKDRYIFKIST